MRIPPLVGIEPRIVGGANRRSRLVALQGAMKYSAEPARVIGIAHHYDGVKPLLIAPARKCRAFILGAGYICGNLLDIHNPQRPQLSNKSCGPIFVWDTPTSEFSFHGIRSVGEDCDSRGHAAVNEIGSFKYPSSIGFARNDDNAANPTRSFTTSVRPAARRIDCRIAGTAILATANSTSTNAIPRRSRPVIIVWMIPDEETEFASL